MVRTTSVAAEDNGSVLGDILDILRRGGEITEKQHRKMQERARAEEQGARGHSAVHSGRARGRESR